MQPLDALNFVYALEQTAPATARQHQECFSAAKILFEFINPKAIPVEGKPDEKPPAQDGVPTPSETADLPPGNGA